MITKRTLYVSEVKLGSNCCSSTSLSIEACLGRSVNFVKCLVLVIFLQKTLHNKIILKTCFVNFKAF